MTNKQSDIPEAVASQSWSSTSPNGFGVITTIRYLDKETMLNDSNATDLKLKELGHTEVKKYSGGGGGAFPKKEKDWTGKNCPKDGGRLYKTITKSGKTMVKCENSKWDFTTKTASGCDYIEWPESAGGSTAAAGSVGDDDAFGITEAQKKWIQRLMMEGKIDEATEIEALSKNEAKDIISRAIGK